MAEVELRDALNGAQLVKVRHIASKPVIQVWYGGVQVSVYEPRCGSVWDELEAWTISDEDGRPVEEDEMEHHMRQHFELIRERRGEER